MSDIKDWIQEARDEMAVNAARENEKALAHKSFLQAVFSKVCQPLNQLKEMAGAGFDFETREDKDGSVIIETNIPTVSAIAGYGARTTRSDDRLTIAVSTGGQVTATGDLTEIRGYVYNSAAHARVEGTLDNCDAVFKFVARQAVFKGLIPAK